MRVRVRVDVFDPIRHMPGDPTTVYVGEHTLPDDVPGGEQPGRAHRFLLTPYLAVTVTGLVDRP